MRRITRHLQECVPTCGQTTAWPARGPATGWPAGACSQSRAGARAGSAGTGAAGRRIGRRSHAVARAGRLLCGEGRRREQEARCMRDWLWRNGVLCTLACQQHAAQAAAGSCRALPAVGVGDSRDRKRATSASRHSCACACSPQAAGQMVPNPTRTASTVASRWTQAKSCAQARKG